jgi:hypothetical protein
MDDEKFMEMVHNQDIIRSCARDISMCMAVHGGDGTRMESRGLRMPED